MLERGSLLHLSRHTRSAARILCGAMARGRFVQWRALGEAEREEARFLITKHALERELGLAGQLIKDVLGVVPEDESWPRSRRASVFAKAFASARLQAADPLAGIDTLWHLRNLRFQLALSGTWRERWSLLFFSSVTTPSLFRHHLPSFLIFLHPVFRLVDFSMSRLVSSRYRPFRGTLKRAPAFAIYDPWFIRELILVAAAGRRKPAFSWCQADPQMDGLSCPSFSSISFRRVGLLP